MKIKAVIYGFGEIGKLIAGEAIKRGIEITGVVDINPSLVGKKLGDFGFDSDAAISDELEFEGDVVFLCTGSWLDKTYPQIEDCVSKGFNVLSTCETLSYPQYRYSDIADKIDALAKQNKVSVLGSGINPGFLLDSLLVFLTAPCTEVNSVKAVRSVDALKRRGTFQNKIGIGLDSQEARKQVEEGRISGHAGYAESVMLVCDALNFKPDVIEEGQEVVEEYGKALGLKGYGSALKSGEEVIRIEFHAYSNAEEYEEITIEGNNSVRWRSTGTKGDIGTAATIINLIEYVVKGESGLLKISEAIPFRSRLVV
ncbi:MAG: dihydrodipicolinate reductase [Archaeoglobaceae archaeon]